MHNRQRNRKRNRIASGVFLGICILLVGLALFPAIYRSEHFAVTSDSLTGTYSLVVEYPLISPPGSEIRVKAVLQPEGATSAPANPGMAVAEIQSDTLLFSPSGQISAPLTADHAVTYSWSAETNTPGTENFSLFLFVQGTKEVNGVFLQQPLWARSLAWQVIPGVGSLKIPILFLATLGGLFAFGILLQNSLR
jgi:hypothetical protein